MSGERGGVGWHTYYLLHELLLQEHEEVEFVGYVRPGALHQGRLNGFAEGTDIRWIEAARWLMRWRGHRDRLDLYHGPNFKMHTTGRYGGVVTVHDLWLERYPEYSKKVFGQKASSRRAKSTVHRARTVVTVSHFSAREIADIYGVPADRIAVIHNGVSADFQPIIDEAAIGSLAKALSLPASGFILFVGGADPRKNHRTFLKSVQQYLPALRGRAVVMVGDAVHPFGDYRETARRLGIDAHLRCPGRMSRQQLRVLYSYADVFVFPSLYEGFGMPVLEAMACGAPVITSTTSALPEVAGDAAVLVNPEDSEELGHAMVRLLDDPQAREQIRSRGFARTKLFSWADAAARTLSLYRRLCA
ncbi:MAG: glycosyltransferase family 1 protein [Nitrospiraceae bacterium]